MSLTPSGRTTTIQQEQEEQQQQQQPLRCLSNHLLFNMRECAYKYDLIP